MLLNWVLEKTLESPLDCKEIKPVHPKGNQSWIFIGRTDAEAEAPLLWPPDAKNWRMGKVPDAGKDWRQEKGMTENVMVVWHYWLYGHEFEQALGVGDGQGSLLCCSPWGQRETWLSNWTDKVVGGDWARLWSLPGALFEIQTASSWAPVFWKENDLVTQLPIEMRLISAFPCGGSCHLNCSGRASWWPRGSPTSLPWCYLE